MYYCATKYLPLQLVLSLLKPRQILGCRKSYAADLRVTKRRRMLAAHDKHCENEKYRKRRKLAAYANLGRLVFTRS
jgi:hypothetical protein